MHFVRMRRFGSASVCSLAIGVVAAGALLFSVEGPARAAEACNSSFTPYGYIGQYWKPTAAQSGGGPFGCPTAAEEDYQVPISGLSNPVARRQFFQHGMIVWFPNLGPKALFYAYWAGNGNTIGFGWQDMPPEAHWRLGLSTGGTEQFTDFPGGTVGGHSLTASGSRVILRLVGCAGATDASCGPIVAAGKENAADGLKEPFLVLNSGQNYNVTAPVVSTKTFDTTQLRMSYQAKYKGSGANSVIAAASGELTTLLPSLGCSDQCLPSWFSNNPKTPIVGFTYDTHKSFLGDGFNNVLLRTAFRFDLSSLAGKNVGAATLKLHGKSSWTNFSSASNLCGTQLGVGTVDWWDSPSVNLLTTGNFSQSLNAGASGASTDVDVTAIVQKWVASPSANYGFILRNPDENLGAFTEKSCMTLYDGISLVVATQTSPKYSSVGLAAPPTVHE